MVSREDLTENFGSLEEKFSECRNTTEACPVSFNTVKDQIRAPGDLGKLELKLTCVSSIDREWYEMICIMYSFIDPFCLLFFLYFTDRIFQFERRYINEYNLGAVEARYFTVKIGSIPNPTFIQE